MVGPPGVHCGCVGLGNIGQAVMARLKPFGVSRFVYTGRNKKEDVLEDGAEFVSFEDLIQMSDFVIVTCSYTPDLHKKFNKARNRYMFHNKYCVVLGCLQDDEENLYID